MDEVAWEVELAEATFQVPEDAINTDQLRELYTVEGFMAPFVVVRRKADGVRGSLEFTHMPRWYFNFREA
jgi:hypothetical protein